MKNSKRNTIIVVTIAVVIIAVTLILLLPKNEQKELTDDELIKIAEEKFEKIDSEVFQQQIIEELKNSKLNVNIKKDSTEITTTFNKGMEFDKYICATIIEKNNGKTVATVEIPCFKMNSDSNGKFKNIEYSYEFMNETLIEKIIQKILRNNYGLENIDEIIGSQKYHRRFQTQGTKGNIYYSQDEFFITAVNEITGPIRINGHEYEFNSQNCQKIIDMYKEYKTFMLGLDFSVVD